MVVSSAPDSGRLVASRTHVLAWRYGSPAVTALVIHAKSLDAQVDDLSRRTACASPRVHQAPITTADPRPLCSRP
jgi:hypothetical protein